MKSAEKVKLPKDRKGQTLHIGDEVFVFNGTDPVAQGEVISMTLACFSRAIWSVDLHMGLSVTGASAQALAASTLTGSKG